MISVRAVSLLAVTLALAGATAAAQTPFDDEFESLVLNPRWSWVREDRASWRLTGSALQITTQPGALNGQQYNDVRNLLVQDAPGQDIFKMETELHFHPDSMNHNAGLLYYIDDDNYIRVSRGIYKPDTLSLVDGVWLEWENGDLPEFRFVNGVTDTLVYLRLIRRSMTSFLARYSLDGVLWYDIGTADVAFAPGTPRMGLQAANGEGILTTPDRIDATFDYFRVDLATNAASPAGVPSAPAITALSPNPSTASGILTIGYTCPASAELRFVLTDALGRTLRTTPVSARGGSRTFPFDVGRLAPGTYTVMLLAGRAIDARSFVVVR